jgi:diadenosine tetraphosphatase ApaH/serine/threonine PP2A family protein phosphatase
VARRPAVLGRARRHAVRSLPRPDDDTTIVTELTTDEKLAGLLSDVEQRRVVAGHTHMQLERRVGDKLFVNAGSIGRPYEGRAGAYWAILDEGVSCVARVRPRARGGLVRRSGHRGRGDRG